MAGTVDIIINKEALADIDKAISKIQQLQTNIVETSKIARNNQPTISTPSGLSSSTSNNAAITAQMQAQKKSIQDLHATNAKLIEQTRLSEIRLQQQREKAFDKYEKQFQREQQKLEAAQSLYGKVQAKLNVLNNEYKNLAVQKELSGKLTDTEAKRYDFLSSKITKYDTVLKGVDASMGKYTRNVGNYAGSFNPLSNSINQLSREMPAFSNSVQTGFLAISNNLPIFFDAIQGVITQNKELQAQGKPTQSVFKQLASSLFSFGTLLSVGVTLLTIYGDEIVRWASGISIADEEAKKLRSTITEVNNQQQTSVVQLEALNSVVLDTTRTEKERLVAYRQLQETMPELEGLTMDQAIATGYLTGITAKYVEGLLARAKAERLASLIAEAETANDIAKTKSLEDQTKWYEKIQKNLAKVTDYINGNNNVEKEIKDIVKKRLSDENAVREKTIATYKELYKQNLITAEQLEKELKGLNKKANAQKNLTLETKDYLASQYELNKVRSELEAKQFEEIYKDETKSLDQRILAYSKYIDKSIKMQENAMNRSIQMIEFEKEKDIKTEKEKYNDFILNKNATDSQKILATKELNKSINSIEKKSYYDIEKIQIESSNKIVDIKKDEIKRKQELIEANIIGIETSKLNQQELDDLRQHQNNLINITRNTSEQALKKIDEDRNTNSFNNQRIRIENDILYLNEKLSKETEFTESYIKLQDKIISKQKELTNITITENEKKKEDQKKYLEDIKSYLKSFSDDFIGNSGFSETFKILNGEITGFGENFAVTFNAIAESAQETFNFISETSQRNFEAEYARLESQKDIALGFAGESAAGRKQIEEQYEARKKDIANRENKAKQKQAIFNIAIDTAQAIIATLAKTPPPAGLPLAFTVGALGAIQIAAVASQKIPQYFEGGTHGGGLAMINDGPGSNYVETVVTPDGKAKQYTGRNVITPLPAGTEIYTHEQWQKEQLLPMLNSRGISTMPNIQIENKGVTYEQMDKIIGKYFSNIKTHNTTIDKKGFNSFIQNGMNRTIINNNRVSGTGISV